MIVLATPQAMTDPVGIADVITKVRKSTDKPILPSFVGGIEMKKGVDVLEQDRLLNYNDPERAAYTMRMLPVQQRQEPGLRDAHAVRGGSCQQSGRS